MVGIPDPSRGLDEEDLSTREPGSTGAVAASRTGRSRSVESMRAN